MTSDKWKWVFYAVLGIVLVILIPLSPRYVQTLAISIIIYSIYVCSTNLLTGYTGLVSLGQAIFWGSAAYLVAILTTHGVVKNFYLVFLIAILSVMIIGAAFGVLALRAKRLYFMILTFAFGHVVWSIAMYALQPVTYGFNGIRDILRPDLGLSWSLENNSNFYYFTLAVGALCFFIVSLIIHSPFGRILVGIRDNEHRMIALGCNTFLYKFLSYIVSAIIAGVGGILFAYFNGYVNPSELHWVWSGEALMMMFIGGIGTFWGPALGALVFTGLRYWVSAYTMYWFGVEGTIFVLVVLFFRGGISGFITDLPRRKIPSKP
ncbi:MAG TPA: branched-chain amino acid ABC transporter permease [Thermodesulfobacteriota bacterium]|nr:branched-chain amino acid ABC transporter permease [Thermodesulfobacteriota bacterium]